MTTKKEQPTAPSASLASLYLAAGTKGGREQWSGVYTNLSKAYEEQCRKKGCRIARFSMNPGLCDEVDDSQNNVENKKRLPERVTVRLDNDETVTGHVFHYVKSKDYVIVDPHYRTTSN